jgi:tetratricopeptide (TPR) repeat protein
MVRRHERDASMSEAAARRTLGLDPAAPEIWRRLAFAAFAESPASAVRLLGRAMAGAPTALDWSNLAEMRRAAGIAGAMTAARRAQALEPRLAVAHSNLGNLLMHADRPLIAERCFARALSLDPRQRDATYNRASALAELGRHAEAIRLYDALIATEPDFFEARWNRTLTLLAAQPWAEGWRDHELRRAHPDLSPRRFACPPWDGSDLAGRRILLASEQGLGDTLQFARYVPEVIARGGRVILDVQAPLLDLARSIDGVEDVIASGSPVPHVDVEAPLMSLPLLLGPSMPPPKPPYLKADPERRERWRTLLASDPRPQIGIAWSGNPAHRYNRRRSLDAEALATLASIASVRFVSLQKEKGAPSGWLDLAPDLDDTAALLCELDLVIAIDSAIAHLAGALDRPLWMLLAPGVDWRWPQGPRTPWYPQARQIWRQAEASWSEAIAALARRLGAAPLDVATDF